MYRRVRTNPGACVYLQMLLYSVLSKYLYIPWDELSWSVCVGNTANLMWRYVSLLMEGSNNTWQASWVVCSAVSHECLMMCDAACSKTPFSLSRSQRVGAKRMRRGGGWSITGRERQAHQGYHRPFPSNSYAFSGHLYWPPSPFLHQQDNKSRVWQSI
jgi:hypothetical protein